MNDLARGERLQIMLTQDELEALDNWRFSRRMPSRAAAVRELLKRGLATEGIEIADGRTRSQDFGVINLKSSGGEEISDSLDGLDGVGADDDGLDGHGA
jgi:hypothetical protein